MSVSALPAAAATAAAATASVTAYAAAAAAAAASGGLADDRAGAGRRAGVLGVGWRRAASGRLGQVQAAHLLPRHGPGIWQVPGPPEFTAYGHKTLA